MEFKMEYVRLGTWQCICEELSRQPKNASFDVKREYLKENKRERGFLKSLGLDLVFWSPSFGWRLRKDWQQRLERLTELKKATYRPLRELVDNQCRPQGHYGISACHRPDLTEEQLNEFNDWYGIGLPYALVVYRHDDIPDDPDYSHSDLFKSKPPAVVIRKKTEGEYFSEEMAASQLKRGDHNYA